MDADNSRKDKRFVDEWRDNFKKEVPKIQLEYDSFLLNKNIEDYYSLQSNEEENALFLKFNDVHGLPKIIMNALELAFIDSMPDKV
jgi:hypothetical protein